MALCSVVVSCRRDVCDRVDYSFSYIRRILYDCIQSAANDLRESQRHLFANAQAVNSSIAFIIKPHVYNLQHRVSQLQNALHVIRSNIGPWLLLRTNRKSHTRFPFDRCQNQRLEKSLCALLQNTCAVVLLVSYFQFHVQSAFRQAGNITALTFRNGNIEQITIKEPLGVTPFPFDSTAVVSLWACGLLDQRMSDIRK